jgi:hypothetical protein
MIDHDALLRLALALPDDTALPVPKAWLVELLEGTAAPQQGRQCVALDLTLKEAGAALHLGESTVRALCSAGTLEGAYLLGGSWRVPAVALERFQERARAGHHSKLRRAAP